MIALIKRLVRRAKRVCLDCGAQPMKGCHHCRDCSLALIKDFDEPAAELIGVLTGKPAYHEDNDPHWTEDDHYSCGDKS